MEQRKIEKANGLAGPKRSRKPRDPADKVAKQPSTVHKPVKPVIRCILCPDQTPTQLMPIHRAEAVKPQISAKSPDIDTQATKTDGHDIVTEIHDHNSTVNPQGKQRAPEYAHLACVRSTPELWLADVWDAQKNKSVRKVMGIENIGRERWNLVSAIKHGLKCPCQI